MTNVCGYTNAQADAILQLGYDNFDTIYQFQTMDDVKQLVKSKMSQTTSARQILNVILWKGPNRLSEEGTT